MHAAVQLCIVGCCFQTLLVARSLHVTLAQPSKLCQCTYCHVSSWIKRLMRCSRGCCTRAGKWHNCNCPRWGTTAEWPCFWRAFCCSTSRYGAPLWPALNHPPCVPLPFKHSKQDSGSTYAGSVRPLSSVRPVVLQASACCFNAVLHVCTDQGQQCRQALQNESNRV